MKTNIKRQMSIRTKTKSNGTTTVIASTPTPDRYNDIVAGGDEWIIEDYMKNPVVQFGHDYSRPPIGKTERLTTDKDGNLIATIRWDDVPTNPLAQTVSAQFASGMMSAVSVGFQPTTSIERRTLPKDHPAHGATGMFFTGNRLHEISAVPVPANGEALALRSMGMSQAKSIISVEETDDTYIVTYQKYPKADDEPEDEEEAFGEDEEEGEEEAAGEDEEDEDGDRMRPEPYDEEEEDDEEEEERAFNARVRHAVLHLLGHDPTVRSALTGSPKKKPVKRSPDSLTNLFGLDK